MATTSYASSQNIKIFPVAKIRESDVGSRLFYESNTANMVKQLLDTAGFVIAYDETTNILEFNLGGYNVILTIDENFLTPFSTLKKVYASLKFVTGVKELCQDDDGSYLGIEFSDTSGDLQILELSGSAWKVPSKSYNKFNTTSLNISEIDAGDFDQQS